MSKNKKDASLEVMDKEIPSSNRLAAQFNRVKKKKGEKSVDLTEIQDSVQKRVYINTKDSKEKSDELDYNLKKMNHMGKGTHVLLETLYPSIKQDRVKVKKKKTAYSSVAFPAAIIGAMATPALASKFSKPIKNILSKASTFKKNKKANEKEGDPDNIFGLTSSDKGKLKKMQAKTGDQNASMDKVIRIASSGAIATLPALIFNFTNYKNSGIYLAFKEQIEKFQTGALEIFTKIFENTVKWIKDNIYDPTIGVGKNLWNKLKNIAINKINLLFKSELSNEPITDVEPVNNSGPILVDAIRSMVMAFSGKGDVDADIDGADDTGRKKSFVDKIAEKAAELASSTKEDSPEFDTGEEFQGLPKGSSLSTASGMQLGIYSGLRKAGFNDNQSRILTAEIGREGSYDARNVFGYHKDPKKGINLGMISWQGSRGRKLEKWMANAGLVKNGKLEASQASIDMQAKFIMHEIRTDSLYKRTKKLFLENPNVSYNVAKEVLGNNYIVWRYTDKNFAQGHKNRDQFYAKINKQLKNQQSGGEGDMNWDSVKAEPSPKPKSINKASSDDKKPAPQIIPKIDAPVADRDMINQEEPESVIIKDIKETPLALPNKKAATINTNMRGKRRNVSQPTISPKHKKEVPVSQNKRQSFNSFSPSQNQPQSSANSSEATSPSMAAATGYKELIKSPYQMMLERDLTGMMF